MFFAIVLYVVGACELLVGLFVLIADMGISGICIALLLFAGSFKAFALGFLLENTTKTNEHVESLQYRQEDMIKDLRNELYEIEYAIKNTTTKRLE